MSKEIKDFHEKVKAALGNTIYKSNDINISIRLEAFKNKEPEIFYTVSIVDSECGFLSEGYARETSVNRCIKTLLFEIEMKDIK